MTVHTIVEELCEKAWLSSEETTFYRGELGLALLGAAAGFPLVSGPFEVFEEVADKAGLRHNLRSYYRRRFSEALDEHVERLERDLDEEVWVGGSESYNDERRGWCA